MRFRYQRWMLRTALAYLIVGGLLGLCLYLAKAVPAFRWAFRWRTVHVHLLLVGFMLQTIMGVGLWMFPRRKAPPGWTTEGEGMALYLLFNAGTLLRLVEPFQDRPPFFWLAFAGASLQGLAFLYFLYLVLPRIRALGVDRK